jgi:hypothetical protein
VITAHELGFVCVFVLLSHRGPGAVLGDDAVRDRRLAVGVVAAEDGVVTLRVSPQKFLASLDPLTLRLFSRLRQQQDNSVQVGRRIWLERQLPHPQQQPAASVQPQLAELAADVLSDLSTRVCPLVGRHHCSCCCCQSSFGRGRQPTATTAQAAPAPSRRPAADPAAGHFCRGHPQHTCPCHRRRTPTAAAPPCVAVDKDSKRQPRRRPKGAGGLPRQQPADSKGRAHAAAGQLTGPAAGCEARGREGRRASSCSGWRADRRCCMGGAAACGAQGGPVRGAATDAVCQAPCGGEALF